MTRKRKYNKIKSNLLFEITIPGDLWGSMDSDDRTRLTDLNRLDMRWKAGPNMAMIFQLGDIFKVRESLRKYGYTVSYPERTILKKYGLTYSGGSIDIQTRANDFLISQQFPDGRVETHIIPKDRVFRVYYTIKHYFESHAELEKVTTPIIWEQICKKEGITRFFDRSGKFHSNSFFGARSTYFDFAYFPLKVLQHIGKIRYEGKYVYNILKKKEML